MIAGCSYIALAAALRRPFLCLFCVRFVLRLGFQRVWPRGRVIVGLRMRRMFRLRRTLRVRVLIVLVPATMLLTMAMRMTMAMAMSMIMTMAMSMIARRRGSLSLLTLCVALAAPRLGLVDPRFASAFLFLLLLQRVL